MRKDHVMRALWNVSATICDQDDVTATGLALFFRSS
jgi:hypothetical protein